MLEQDVPPPEVPSFHQMLAQSVDEWPSFEPPTAQHRDPLTVLDVALAESMEKHMDRSRAWANQVWSAWKPYHDFIAELVDDHKDQMRRRGEKRE